MSLGRAKLNNTSCNNQGFYLTSSSLSLDSRFGEFSSSKTVRVGRVDWLVSLAWSIRELSSTPPKTLTFKHETPSSLQSLHYITAGEGPCLRLRHPNIVGTWHSQQACRLRTLWTSPFQRVTSSKLSSSSSFPQSYWLFLNPATPQCAFASISCYRPFS